jgi:nitrogen regulatory protein PII
MSPMVEVQAVVRQEMLDRVVHQLKEADCARLIVTRVHSIGAGVDPDAERYSVNEGSAYAEKALVSFICAAERCDMYTELIARAGRSGRRGDGFVTVRRVDDVVNIRTGSTGLDALA